MKNLALIITPILAFQSFEVISQDCHPTILKTAPDTRYVINDDQTVSDLETGLVWKRCIEGQRTVNASLPCASGSAVTKTWQAALQAVQTLNQTGGFAQVTTWRLPSIKELMSTLELSCRFPAINITIFPVSPGVAELPAIRYWSSTTLADSPLNAWNMRADFGIASSTLKATNSYNIRLVYDAK